MYLNRDGLRFILVALLIPLLLALLIFFVLAVRPGKSVERRRDKLSSMIDQSPIEPPPEPTPETVPEPPPEPTPGAEGNIDPERQSVSNGPDGGHKI